MMKRALIMLLCLCCLCTGALAGGKTAAGKDAHLTPQAGEYEPRYSVSGVYEVLPGTEFELVLYEDSGVLPLQIARNGSGVPSGVSFLCREKDGKRQACLTGLVYAEGEYGFSLLIQEAETEESLRTLAILHVTLCITSAAPVTTPYLGDGQGMLRVAVDGVNFRRTPGGTRLCQYDEGKRLVWTWSQEKGGYIWYRVWTEDYGYGWIRADMVQLEPPLRIVYTPGKETAFPLFITAGRSGPLTPNLIMTGRPEVIGFDTQPLATVLRGKDTWTLLCFRIDGTEPFFIKVDLRDEYGVPLECQLVYLTTQWEEIPPFSDQ